MKLFTLIANFSLDARKQIKSYFIKLVSILIVFAVVPIAPAKAKSEKYETNIKLDQNTPEVLVLDTKKVEIATGESNLDSQKVAKSNGQLASANYSRGIERDGSYFQSIYKSAAAKYGIPWQLLQAVHYVETGCSDSGSKSSYAGAQGPMQFMPGTFRAYGEDGNGDGSTDINNVNDAIYAAAHLLANSGADAGDIDGALLNYNHSWSYVNKVKEVMSSVQ